MSLKRKLPNTIGEENIETKTQKTDDDHTDSNDRVEPTDRHSKVEKDEDDQGNLEINPMKRKLSNTIQEEDVETKKPKMHDSDETSRFAEYHGQETGVTLLETDFQERIKKDSESGNNKESDDCEDPIVEDTSSEHCQDDTSQTVQRRTEADDFQFLFRLLRDGELKPDGICAKNPYSTRSLVDHVVSGSKGSSSKYISTSASIYAVNKLSGLKNRSKHRNGCKTKIKIDVGKLPLAIQIIDLRKSEIRSKYAQSVTNPATVSTFDKYASEYDEVLLVGHIPRECITVI